MNTQKRRSFFDNQSTRKGSIGAQIDVPRVVAFRFWLIKLKHHNILRRLYWKSSHKTGLNPTCEIVSTKDLFVDPCQRAYR